MRLLLDTHVVVWAMVSSARLGAGRALVDGAQERVLSAAVVWELAIKARLGKIDLGSDVRSWTERAARELDASWLDVSRHHAAAVEELPDVHRDPFDRLLVAQAQVGGLVLLTADQQLAGYGPAVRVLGAVTRSGRRDPG